MTDEKRSGAITRWPILVAAALIVAGGVAFYFVTRPAPPPTNAQGLTASGIRSLSGSGELVGPEARFEWSRDARADVYRLEVYDLSSQLLAAAVLRDTFLVASAVLPDSSHAGIWRVIPVSPGGTELPGTSPARFDRR